eukprot:341180_1
MMASSAGRYGRKKKSSKRRIPLMKKSTSVPQEKQTVDWPGNIDDKYIEDVKNRLTVIEQNCVSDDMIRAFLAANNMTQRDAVESLKKTVEWRKGRQMFWNNYRSQNERYQFLQQTRKCGTGIASTYGHTKQGRLVFYEKIGENFSIPLHKEFSISEFIDHVIVWCEDLLNASSANCGKSIHLIHEIPYYKHEQNKQDEKDDSFPDTQPINNNSNNLDNNNNNNNNNNNHYHYKHKFKRLEIENKCKFSDVVGIIDWDQISEEIFIENKDLLIAAGELLSIYYPHLINRFYHVNMPLNFEKIENILKPNISTQIIQKSIFLESSETKQKRIDYMKKYGKRKPSIRRNNYKSKSSKKIIDEKNININIGPNIDEYASNKLLSIINS